MEDHIVKYFSAEKSESLLFITIGILAFICSFYFFFLMKEAFYKGMIIPLILIGSIQLIVGTTVYFRSDKDISTTQSYILKGSEIIKSKELPRMNTVMKNFTIYKWIEIGFIIIGIALLLTTSAFNYWKGFGLAMLIQGSFMFVLDIFAEKRALEYINFICDL